MKTDNFDVIIVGSGAAGYAAACRVAEAGKRAAIVTEDRLCGTSRNAGSDKQTYYKLSLSDESDSVYEMAKQAFGRGSVDGDTALAEAASSARCFYYLLEAGVPFPTDAYGRAVGYKTDNDPACRATSAGPLTSKIMTEVLEKRAAGLGVPVFSGLTVTEVLKSGGKAVGVLAFDKQGNARAFSAPAVILAVGGPASVYADTVYPDGQSGSTGLAVRAGAKLVNMTEWQYGLASKAPKWNVSGSYMQVLPRFVSVDENGVEREFLRDIADDVYSVLSLVFLKGYQWPFDEEKSKSGSSLIDLAVLRETAEKGRRVFLDFSREPFGLDRLDSSLLSDEAREYLEAAGAILPLPCERLKKLNLPAYEFYRERGTDLCGEMLEISLCAQHCNGGIAVDADWQTSVPGLFAIGECAGTHGKRRAGGSALNAGQVGALRASLKAIKAVGVGKDEYDAALCKAICKSNGFISAITGEESNLKKIRRDIGRAMSDCAAAKRNADKTSGLLDTVSDMVHNKEKFLRISSASETAAAYKLADTLYTVQAILAVLADKTPLNDGEVCEVVPTEDGLTLSHRAVRPLPEKAPAFERVWAEYRENFGR